MSEGCLPSVGRERAVVIRDDKGEPVVWAEYLEPCEYPEASGIVENFTLPSLPEPIGEAICCVEPLTGQKSSADEGRKE